MVDSTTPIIKICGLSNPESLAAVVESGASHVGFMFARSRRQVSLELAAELISGMHGDSIEKVGVVVNETPDRLDEIVRVTGIDRFQLSGDESVEILDHLDVPAWKVFRFGDGITLDKVKSHIDPWFAAKRPIDAVMIDASVAGLYGGSGHRANWTLASQLAEIYPLILAGGLSPDNVEEAIAQVHPLGVDVSSGVERDGAKHVGLIGTFVKRAAQAFSSSR